MKCVLMICVLAAVGGCSVGMRGGDQEMRGAGANGAVVGEGVEARGVAYEPGGVRKEGAWRAEWVRVAGEDGKDAAGGGVVSMLRKEVVLDGEPGKVMAWMTGEETFRVYVNGVLAARGPVDNGRDFTTYTSGRWFYEGRDLSAFFHRGKNVIAVELFKVPFVGSSWRTGHAGFLFEAEATSGGKTKMIASDASWRGVNGSQWAVIKGGAAFDAAKEPVGWREKGFDDSSWGACMNAGAWWEKLEASEIPPRMEVRYPVMGIERASAGVTGDFARGGVTVPKEGGSFAVRFDRVLSGYVTMRAKGSAGAEVTIEPNEVDAAGHHRWMTVKLREGETAVELPFMDSFSTVNVTVKGGGGGSVPVVLEEVGAIFTSQPVTYRGAFECSDAQLNTLWKAERWATQLCMQTHHLDSPHHQEPTSDTGDYLIEARVNYDTFGEKWLARQDLRKIGWILPRADFATFHTSYSLLWLQMLMEYAERTGDEALVKELAPSVFGLLDRYTGWRGKNGLISEAPNYMFMDWVTIDGIPCHHPPAVIGQGYLTAFYYRGLADAKRVAEMVGDTQRAAAFEKLRGEVRGAFERELWVGEKGVYRDGKPRATTVKPSKWLPADTEIETFSTQVNALAVLYGLAPKERRAALMERVMGRADLNCQAYFMHFVFDALAAAGPGVYQKYATQEMRRWVVNPVTQTAREMWERGDWSHGWVATPVVQMSERILGVAGRPSGVIEISPMMCDLAWAKGRVPVGEGEVSVSWRRQGEKVRVEVEVPRGRSAVVSLGGGEKLVEVEEGTSVVDFP